MAMIVQRLDEVDRTGWPAGPWDAEGDYYSWSEPTTGTPCLIVRQAHFGALCGYAAVEPGHPLHGKDYEAVYELHPEIVIHGDLNFAAECHVGQGGHVCHVPEPGRSGDVWWFGFDCSHAWDLLPGMRAREMKMGMEDPHMAEVFERLQENQHYWTAPEVIAEVERLAVQLAGVK